MRDKDKTKAISIVIIGAILLLAGCIGQPDADNPGQDNAGISAPVNNISSLELKEKLKNKDFFLLDVHIPEQEHIAGTDAFIPFDEIEQNIGKLPEDKDARIVVYCRSGNMGITATEKLMELGYTNVANLEGGIKAFNALGEETGPEVPNNETNEPENNGAETKDSEKDVVGFFDSAIVQEIVDEIIPIGTPFYGDENISFDNPELSVKFFEKTDSYFGKMNFPEKIILEGDNLERYERIAPKMTCEFCCGPAMIENCGCNHAAAYRGLAKYLIEFHGDELSDGEIIDEQVKWKNLWFQQGAVVKELKLQNADGEVSPEDLDKLLGMVGGC